jgi:3-deoxy-D-manno-octulosonic acid kinase
VAAPRAWGFASDRASAWLGEVLGAGDALHAWAARQPAQAPLTGRGRAWAVGAPADRHGLAGRWVVRHYRRGGQMAYLLRDRYLAVGMPRPVRELGASLEVSRRGIPTPAVVAGAVYPSGLFYRADLVTEEIAGGKDLAEFIFGGAGAPQGAAEALAAAGALVRRLDDTGISHPDLNAKNLVLQPTHGGVRAYLVDLDGCRADAPGAAGSGRAMLARLERSLRKHGARSGRPLAPASWNALREGFGAPGAAP